MSRVTGNGTSSSWDSHHQHGPSPIGEYFADFWNLVKQHGWKGIGALLVAAVLAFAPLSVLYWFCELRLTSPLTNYQGTKRVVHAGQTEQEQEEEEAGETALLQVICETTSFSETRTLLVDDDPRRSRDFLHDSLYVTRERVYLRPAHVEAAGIEVPVPFALLGPPPVSVWLPAGDYEILVIHEDPGGERSEDGRRRSFPFVSVRTEVSLENKQKTVCRVPLPHYGFGQGFAPQPVDEATQIAAQDDLSSLLTAWEQALAVPTPNGYLLALAEPTIHHADGHQGCTIDFADTAAVPREWTREQLAEIRNWLPAGALAAKDKLNGLIGNLGWREFFAGWYCYAIAGVTGLVFTRWGALAMLEPWRHRESFFDNLMLLLKIFGCTVAVWFLFAVLTDGSSCSGPIRFRLR